MMMHGRVKTCTPKIASMRACPSVKMLVYGRIAKLHGGPGCMWRQFGEAEWRAGQWAGAEADGKEL